MTWADSIKAVFWIVSIGALLFLSAGTSRLAKRLDLHGRVCDRRPCRDAVVGMARSRITQRAHGRTVPEGVSVLGQGVHGVYHRRLV